MPLNTALLIWIAAIAFILIFLVFSLFFIVIFFKWLRSPRAYYPPIRVEDYMCPKCGSKELDVIGLRTLRCRKCGTIFSLGGALYRERWIIWPFFWLLPLVFFMEKD